MEIHKPNTLSATERNCLPLVFLQDGYKWTNTTHSRANLPVITLYSKFDSEVNVEMGELVLADVQVQSNLLWKQHWNLQVSWLVFCLGDLWGKRSRIRCGARWSSVRGKQCIENGEGEGIKRSLMKKLQGSKGPLLNLFKVWKRSPMHVTESLYLPPSLLLSTPLSLLTLHIYAKGIQM